MKPEQEQIEQMIKIFKNNREVCHYTSCIKCKYRDDEDCMCSSCAYSLYQAGFGDVSEYKAEIEQLKAEIKQAKIDTLTKVKKCSCCDNFFPDSKWHRYVFVDDIDKLIEEIENDRI